MVTVLGWVALALAAVLGATAAIACIVGVTGTPLALPVALALAVGGHRCWRYGNERVVGDIYERIGVEGEWTDGRRERTPADDWHREGWRATVGGRDAGDGEWTGDDWRWADGARDGWTGAGSRNDRNGTASNGRGDADGRTTGRSRTGGAGAANGGRGTNRRGTDRRGSDGRGIDGRAPGGAAVGIDPELAAAYRVLGVDADADADAIRRAYRERAKETHPDAGGDREAFKRVRWAYERVRERR
ncbi:J domain-containing protein [Halomarina pelagica]|uniref:J domain-containing protein n=1 Tax=Halomarina pelagica TaxID=2961599 RepID=UPI0020C2A15E|nr:J domain-containing protein [Halomarina sp. BND7]